MRREGFIWELTPALRSAASTAIGRVLGEGAHAAAASADVLLGYKLNVCSALVARLSARASTLLDAVGGNLLAGLEVVKRGRRAGGLRADDPEVLELATAATVAAHAVGELVREVKRDAAELVKFRCITDGTARLIRDAAEKVVRAGGSLAMVSNAAALAQAALQASGEFLSAARPAAASLRGSGDRVAQRLAEHFEEWGAPLVESAAASLREKVEGRRSEARELLEEALALARRARVTV